MAHPAVVRKPPVARGLSGYSTEDLYTELITRLGEDPGRDGLLKTPQRTAQAMTFLTKGYQEDAEKILRGALFEVDYDEMVIVRDIEVFSLCEHHMLPFFGKVHVAYIPNGKSDRAEQDTAAGRGLCAPLAGPGAAYPAGCRCHSGCDRAPGCGCGDRGQAPLHDDAWGREAALLDRDLRHAGSLSRAEHAG